MKGKKYVCPICSADLKEEEYTCPECRAEFESPEDEEDEESLECPLCGHLIEADDLECLNCGEKFDDVEFLTREEKIVKIKKRYQSVFSELEVILKAEEDFAVWSESVTECIKKLPRSSPKLRRDAPDLIDRKKQILKDLHSKGCDYYSQFIADVKSAYDLENIKMRADICTRTLRDIELELEKENKKIVSERSKRKNLEETLRQNTNEREICKGLNMAEIFKEIEGFGYIIGFDNIDISLHEVPDYFKEKHIQYMTSVLKSCIKVVLSNIRKYATLAQKGDVAAYDTVLELLEDFAGKSFKREVEDISSDQLLQEASKIYQLCEKVADIDKPEDKLKAIMEYEVKNAWSGS